MVVYNLILGNRGRISKKTRKAAQERLEDSLPKRKVGDKRPIERKEFLCFKRQFELYIKKLRLSVEIPAEDGTGVSIMTLVDFCQQQAAKPLQLLIDNYEENTVEVVEYSEDVIILKLNAYLYDLVRDDNINLGSSNVDDLEEI